MTTRKREGALTAHEKRIVKTLLRKPAAQVLREFMRKYVSEHDAPIAMKEMEHAVPRLTGAGYRPK